MKIETIKTADLIPYARNSRTHSEEQISQIVGSIREFGFTNPVLIDAENGIIAGHGRVMAAGKLGMDKVPCIRLPHLTENQKRAYIIADNKLALNAGWDEELLGLELADLASLDFDMDLLGFSDDELSALMTETADGIDDPDELPELPDDPVTAPGDVWVMGRHRLVCGDSKNQLAVEKLLDGESASVCVVDPPFNEPYFDYCFPLDCEVYAVWGKYANQLEWEIGKLHPLGMKFDEYIFFGGVRGHLISNTPCVLHDTVRIHFQDKCERFTESVLKISDIQKTGDGSRPKSVQEHSGGVLTGYGGMSWGKPLISMEMPLLYSAGGIVLDICSGSGTALVAAEKHGMEFRGIENQPKWCDLIVSRWQKLTGKQAVHEASGKTFDEMKNEKS